MDTFSVESIAFSFVVVVMVLFAAYVLRVAIINEWYRFRQTAAWMIQGKPIEVALKLGSAVLGLAVIGWIYS